MIYLQGKAMNVDIDSKPCLLYIIPHAYNIIVQEFRAGFGPVTLG
jgi:hypothetical protein